MRTLYHYTSIERWELIQASGRLNTTESNLSQHREHAWPSVVWLTTDPDCQHGHGLLNTLDGTDKTRVRIAVELPNRDVHKWHEWAERRGRTPIGSDACSVRRAAVRARGASSRNPYRQNAGATSSTGSREQFVDTRKLLSCR